MFKQGSLFDMYGLEDYQSPEEKKKEKEASKKKEPEKAKSKEAKKKAANVSVSLPVTVISGTWQETITDIDGRTDKVSLKDIAMYLFKLGYKYFAHKDVVFLTDYIEKGILYVGINKAYVEPQMDVQLFSASDTVTVALDGMVNAEYTLSQHFADKNREEVSVQDLRTVFSANYTEYSNCSFNFDIESGILLAQFKEKKVQDIQFPCQIQCLDEVKKLTEADLTDKDTASAIFKKVLGQTQLPDASLVFMEDTTGVLIPVFQAKGKMATFDKTDFQCSKGAKTKTAEEYYKLPLTLNLVIYGITHPLTPEDFNGKEKVTQKEIAKYLQSSYPIFSDPSRKPVWHYLESHSLLGIGFESGKKGYQAEALHETAHVGPCKLIRSMKDFMTAKAADFFYGTFYADEKENVTGNDITVFSSHLACITARSLGMARYDKLEFDLRIPKIPKSVLDEVIGYFKEDLSKEAIVRIYYSNKTKAFQVVKPSLEKSSKNRTIYTFLNSVINSMETEQVQVCEIHSHNTMPAYFSKIDDADEAYGIGFYGVMGELDKKVPQMAFRLAFNGSFRQIELEEIADIKKEE